MLNARVIALALLTSVGLGCATASVSGKFPSTTHSDAGPMRLFVMPAGAVRSPGTGNVGVSFADVQRLIDERVLAIARERDPGATLAPIDGTAQYRPIEPYLAAAAPATVTPSELNAAGYARQHGGTHLLVPTILEWRQMRADDPIGGFIEPLVAPYHRRRAIALHDDRGAVAVHRHELPRYMAH